jgi:hypothetical protein
VVQADAEVIFFAARSLADEERQPVELTGMISIVRRVSEWLIENSYQIR